jgi:hypothetical protein
MWWRTTRAPAAVATATLPSADPLSTTSTSPRMPRSRIVWTAFATQVPTVRSSFRQGMTTVNSTAGRAVSIDSSIRAGSSGARTGMKGLGTWRACEFAQA